MSITQSIASERSLGVALGALIVVLLAAPAHAQVVELDTIVVEGTGLDSEPIPVDQTGSAVTVVTGEELQRQQVRHAAEALRSLPGVSVSRMGTVAGLTDVRIRGAESNHTLVLIDGIEANAATEGLFDFSDLMTDDIERIEVIRGPQSGLYGSNAVGGVVNVVTKRGRGPLALTTRVEGGSFNTRGVAASLAAGSDEAHGRLTVQSRSTDGFNIAPVGDEKDGADITAMSFKGGGRVLPNLEIDVTLRHGLKKGDRDGDGGEPGDLATQVDTDSHFGTRLTMAGVEARLDTLGGALVHRFRADGNMTSREDTSVSEFGTSFSLNDSETRRLQYLSTLKSEMPVFGRSRHSLTGLLEHKEQVFTPVTQDGIARRRESNSIALDYHGDFYDMLNLHAAVRHDENDVTSDFTTYRLAGSLALPGTPLRLHGSAGTGVKLPSMFEQFGFVPGFFVPNPDLQPEESFGWDAGVELSLFGGRTLIDVTYFEADLTDKIASAPAPNFMSTSVNLPGISTREGVEVSLRTALGPQWQVGGAYTYLDARDPDGQREIRRPRNSARGDLTYLFADNKGSVSLSAVYNGAMEDVAFRLPLFTQEFVTLDSYTLVTLAADYEIKPGVSLFGRVENLLDQDYQELFGFETAGIAAFGGVRMRLGLLD